MKPSEFKRLYAEYLKSPTWEAKRAIVLKRDRGLCQSCLREEATEVHHLTYKRVFNEPLFDLVSVCHNCHSFIVHDRRPDTMKAQSALPPDTVETKKPRVVANKWRDRVVMALRVAGPSGLSHRDLLRKCQGLKAWERDDILKTIDDMGYCFTVSGRVYHADYRDVLEGGS